MNGSGMGGPRRLRSDRIDFRTVTEPRRTALSALNLTVIHNFALPWFTGRIGGGCGSSDCALVQLSARFATGQRGRSQRETGGKVVSEKGAEDLRPSLRRRSRPCWYRLPRGFRPS